jgi:nicotinamidase-related amidase
MSSDQSNIDGPRPRDALRTLEQSMPRAILIIDVQQAFREGEHQAFDVERVIGNINRVTSAGRARKLPVIFVQHESTSGPFAHGSPTWQLAAGMAVDPHDHIVRKTASDSFHKSNLENLLRTIGVTELVVCGIQSDFCVDSTVRRALALGFDVRLVEDAHTTLDNGVLTASQISAHHAKTLTSIGSFDAKARLCRSDNALDEVSISSAA